MAGRSEDDPEEFASDPDPDSDPDSDPDASADAPTGESGDGGPAPRTDGTPDGDGEDDAWRFGVDDVDEDGLVQSAIEAEDPELEHAVFVVLGALAMVLVFAHLWTLV